MDEKDGYFRIATTDSKSWREEDNTNNLYVLNENLEIVGKVEYRCLVNVNFSNIKRFLPEVDEVSIDTYKKFPDILYMEKLWNLYNKMRAEYTRTWWD